MVDYAEISENIKQQRYLSRLTQEELAAVSGVSLPTVKKIEAGRTGMRQSTIDAIAKALNVDSSVLMQPARRLRSIRFRTCRNMRSKESVVSDIIHRLDQYNRLEELTGEYLPNLYKTVPAGDAVSTAAAARAIAGLDDRSPVTDVAAAVENFGIKLFTVSVNTEKFFSLSVGEQDGGAAIIINDRLITYEQAVFSLVHELGHILMHRSAEKSISDAIIWEEEDEADVFASYFLMPEPGFRAYWDASEGLRWTDRVIKVKHIFALGYKTVLARLGKFTQLSKRFTEEYGDGIKDHKDPEPLNKKLFLETRLFRLTVNAVAKKLISAEEGARLLRLSLPEMKHLVTECRKA